MKWLFVFLSIAMTSLTLTAKDSTAVWVDAGLGSFNSSSTQGGLYFYGSLASQSGNHLLKGRFAYGDEFNIVVIGESQLSENFFSTDFLYGYGKFDKSIKAYLAAGVGLISGVKRGDRLQQSSGLFSGEEYQEVDFASVSLPIEANLQVVVGKHMAIGAVLFTDLSPAYANTGFAFSLCFGQLR